MANAAHAVTVTGANGRIWKVEPSLHPNTGLVTVLQLPSLNVAAQVKRHEFTACALNKGGDQLVTVDTGGTVYLFQLRHNRYIALDKAGSHGTSVTFVDGNVRQLFVAFSDASIKCYDLAKNVSIGYLKEHRRCDFSGTTHAPWSLYISPQRCMSVTLLMPPILLLCVAAMYGTWRPTAARMSSCRPLWTACSYGTPRCIATMHAAASGWGITFMIKLEP